MECNSVLSPSSFLGFLWNLFSIWNKMSGEAATSLLPKFLYFHHRSSCMGISTSLIRYFNSFKLSQIFYWPWGTVFFNMCLLCTSAGDAVFWSSLRGRSIYHGKSETWHDLILQVWVTSVKFFKEHLAFSIFLSFFFDLPDQ